MEDNIDNIPRQSKAPQKAGGFFGDPALPAAARNKKATLLKNKVAFFRGRLADGIWLLAAGGWCPAAASRLFDDGAGVVFGVVAEGDFGNVYTLTYW